MLQTTGGTQVKALVRLTANLPEEVMDALREMAARNQVTVTEQLRRAISTEKWLEDVRKTDRVLLENRTTGKLREVVFK